VTAARDLCLATRTEDGQTLICWKSPGHITSRSAENREHYDPSADVRWSDDNPSAAADHDACIEPHRSADGYVDCDGRAL
jgi:hypothetical protein